MRADLMQAACTSVGPDKHSQANQRKLVWKTRLSASSDLTETKRKNRQEKLVFKTTQKLNKIPGTLESLPSMVANSVVREISLRTSK
jgi:hypothetical protein